MAKNNDLTLIDAQIIFRNFRGEETMYNRAGNRNFGVIIDDLEVADQMKQDGWNIKYLEPREEGDERAAFVNVTARFDNFPPTVAMISSSGKTYLDDNTVALLDQINIKQADMIINPWHWSRPDGTSGIKAFVKSLFVTIDETELDLKYADIPVADGSAEPLADVDFVEEQ